MSRRSGVKKLFFNVVLPVGLILIAIIAVLDLVRSQIASNGGSLEIGATLPDFQVVQFGKGPIRVSELKGKVILVNFWASWCDGCVTEMPSLKKLARDYRDKGLVVVPINVEENAEAILPSVIRELQLDLPVFFDPDGMAVELFYVHSLPLAAILDNNRKVFKLLSGEVNWDDKDIRDVFDKLLQ